MTRLPAHFTALRTKTFTAFTAIPSPAVPKVGESVALRLQWPRGVKVKSLRLRYQTELSSPWTEVKTELGAAGKLPTRLAFSPFERATPVSYRVDAALGDGQEVEIWGYFQIK